MTGLTIFQTTVAFPVDAGHRNRLLEVGYVSARVFLGERGFCESCKEVVRCDAEMIEPRKFGFPSPTFLHRLDSGPYTGMYCGPLQLLTFENTTFQEIA